MGIEGVANFIDDIIVTGCNDDEHLNALEEVFKRLEDAGLKLKKEKVGSGIWDTLFQKKGSRKPMRE
jgi:hypothetical protein